MARARPRQQVRAQLISLRDPLFLSVYYLIRTEEQRKQNLGRETYLLALKLLFILLLTVMQTAEGIDFVLIFSSHFCIWRRGFLVLR